MCMSSIVSELHKQACRLYLILLYLNIVIFFLVYNVLKSNISDLIYASSTEELMKHY